MFSDFYKEIVFFLNVFRIGHISLLNTLSRIFESIMQKRLYYYCETESILPDSQTAYRKHNSCIDPLIRITQDIHSGFNRSCTTVMVQLDFSKAFDTVWVDGLLYKIQQSGLRGKLPDWISSFLSERKYRIVHPSTTTFRVFSSGVPQGSILSPLLFLIFVADCANSLTSLHAEFADDLTLWFSSYDDSDTFAVLNEDLKKLEEWAHRWGLTFSLTKCTYTVFSNSSRKKPVHQYPKLFFS